MYKRFACLETTEKRSIGTKIKFLLIVKQLFINIINIYLNIFFINKNIIVVLYMLLQLILSLLCN